MGLIRLLPRSAAAQPVVEPVNDATPEMPLEEGLRRTIESFRESDRPVPASA